MTNVTDSIVTGSVSAAPAGPAAAVASSRRGLRWHSRSVLALLAASLVALFVAAGVWWSSYEPVSNAFEFGGEGPGRVILGLRTENSGHFDIRVTGVRARDPAPGIRLDSVRTGSSPAAQNVHPFRPFTLEPGQRLYLVFEYAITCGELSSASPSLGGIEIRYETLWIGRTKQLDSVNSEPKLAPQRACG